MTVKPNKHFNWAHPVPKFFPVEEPNLHFGVKSTLKPHISYPLSNLHNQGHSLDISYGSGRVFMCGLCMFSPCLRAFSPGSLASSQFAKTSTLQVRSTRGFRLTRVCPDHWLTSAGIGSSSPCGPQRMRRRDNGSINEWREDDTHCK